MLQLMKTQGSDELNIEIRYPAHCYTTDGQITELRFSSGQNTSQGTHTIHYFENISIVESTLSTQEVLPVHLAYDFTTVVLEFILSAKQLVCTDAQEVLSISYGAGQHNITFIPKSELLYEHQACVHIEVVRIHISPDYFLRLIPDKDIFHSFIASVSTEARVATLSEAAMPITPAMYVIIRDIQTEQRKGSYKRILLEAKVLELLMLQLEQYEEISGKDQGGVASASIRQLEINKMQQVKEILQCNMQSPYSLIDLAHMVGTNVYTLKKSFKECFGTTVFGYLNQLRMEEAHRLLMAQTHTINQIADLIGYKNANHFSTAFKRYFGYIPSELRR